MEIEHLIGLGVVVIFATLAAWLVWTCMCKTEEEDDCSESQDEIKSVNSRTRVISAEDMDEEIGHHKPFREKHPHPHGEMNDQLQQVITTKPTNSKSKKKNSCYIQSSRQGRFEDPFGEWTRREKEIDDTEALSGIKSYRKSPVMSHRS